MKIPKHVVKPEVSPTANANHRVEAEVVFSTHIIQGPERSVVLKKSIWLSSLAPPETIRDTLYKAYLKHKNDIQKVLGELPEAQRTLNLSDDGVAVPDVCATVGLACHCGVCNADKSTITTLSSLGDSSPRSIRRALRRTYKDCLNTVARPCTGAEHKTTRRPMPTRKSVRVRQTTSPP